MSHYVLLPLCDYPIYVVNTVNNRKTILITINIVINTEESTNLLPRILYDNVVALLPTQVRACSGSASQQSSLGRWPPSCKVVCVRLSHAARSLLTTRRATLVTENVVHRTRPPTTASKLYFAFVQ